MPAIRIFFVRLAFITSVFPLASCLSPYLLNKPIDAIEYATPEQDHDILVILLPGIFDSAIDFERQGWIRAVRDRHLPIDMIAVEAHYGYYFAGNLTERLHRDVIVPARQRGYADVWLVGISLGGFGSLLYSRAYPDDIDGAYLISPFLGSPNRAFDPAEWIEKRHGQDGLWEWLSKHGERQDRGPTIFLGYGEEDKFAEVNGLLARLLVRDDVIRLPGTHDWRTWKALWDEALDRELFISKPDITQSRRSIGRQ